MLAQPHDERWVLSGTAEAEPEAEMAKGTASDGPRLRRMAGWVTVYGTLGPDGGIVPTVDREGQVFEAARQLGLIDWTGYLTKGRGVWNYAHTNVRVGLPSSLEFHDGATALSQTHRKVGFWGAGHLFDAEEPQSWAGLSAMPSREEFERADYLWTLGTRLQKGPRPLAFSVEGTMRLSPCRSRILSAAVERCAVLEYPHNPDATVEAMAKGVRFEFLRRGMLGRRPCGKCSCPPGSCDVMLRGPTPQQQLDEAMRRVAANPRVGHLAQRMAAVSGRGLARERATILARVRAHLEQDHG